MSPRSAIDRASDDGETYRPHYSGWWLVQAATQWAWNWGSCPPGSAPLSPPSKRWTGSAPFDEPEIPAAIADVLGDEGTGVVTGATVTGVRRDGRGRSVLLKTAAGGERERACEQVLVAAGRRPVSAGSRGEILTDTRQRTGNPRIWAAGDVTGGPPYVYTAAAQRSAAANALFQSEREVDYTALPRVTFASPAIASAGLTEAELVRSGVACDCRVLPLAAVPRAIANRDSRGLVKLVAEAGTGRIRGVHAV